MEDSLQQAAVPLKRDSKCKEVIPFYCSSLANPAAPATGFPLRSNKLRGMRSLEHFQLGDSGIKRGFLQMKEHPEL
jgi:hypothetical protein